LTVATDEDCLTSLAKEFHELYLKESSFVTNCNLGTVSRTVSADLIAREGTFQVFQGFEGEQ